ncbi:MAG: SHOCT domain-containing protein [Acidimicrobiales bacterium]
MSVDRLRTAMMLSLAKDGWPDDVAGPVALAVHPFDDAPVPSRSYEKAVRPLARAFAKELGRWPNGDAEGAKRRAVALLAQYRALANAHRESPHFVHRFDQTLLRAQAVAPERPSNKAAAPATPGRLEELSSEWVSLQQQWLELTGQPLPKVDVMTPAEPMSIHQTERVLERLGQRSLGQAEAIAKWEAKVAAFRSQLADAIAPRPAAGAAPPVAERIAELKELAALLEAGHITESEFDQLKQDVLTAKHLAPSSPTLAVPPVAAAPSEAATLQRSPVLPSAPLQVPGVPASHFQPPPAGNGAGQFSTDLGVGSALRSGVGLTAALGWTTTVAAVGGSIAAAVEYRQAFRQ